MGRVSALSGLLAAVGLAVVFQLVGPDLAMGLAIYGGNTEPDRPALEFPVWGLAALVVVIVGLLGASARWQHVSWAALLVSLFAIAYDVRFLLALAAAT